LSFSDGETFQRKILNVSVGRAALAAYNLHQLKTATNSGFENSFLNEIV